MLQHKKSKAQGAAQKAERDGQNVQAEGGEAAKQACAKSSTALEQIIQQTQPASVSAKRVQSVASALIAPRRMTRSQASRS